MGRKRKWQKPPAPRQGASPVLTGGDRSTTEAGEEASISNRLRRKEEARRQREALRRKALRRRKLRLAAIIGGGAIVLAGAATGIVIAATHHHVTLAGREDQLLAQADSASTAAGCTAVQQTPPFNPASEDHIHVTQIPPLTYYPTTPPASGPHEPLPPEGQGPMPAGVYTTPPDIARAIHSLEHGAVIVWYSPTVPSSQLVPLETFFRQVLAADPTQKILMAPYSYPQAGGTLPTGRQMVLVAWHRIEDCNKVSLPAAYKFVRFYAVDISHPSRYRGRAREPGSPL